MQRQTPGCERSIERYRPSSEDGMRERYNANGCSPTAQDILVRQMQRQTPGCERSIERYRPSSEDGMRERYLFISCFASSRSISALILCFCASVGAAAWACFASFAAPAKSPAADLMRA